MREAKESGKVRHIGFTGHTNADAHAYLLEQLQADGPFETVQMPVNPVDAGHPVSFVRQVIPKAFDMKYGILAMKSLAGGQFFAEKIEKDKTLWETDDPVVPGRISMKDTLNFTWSMPVSVLITGASTKAMVREKIELAKKHAAMNEADRQALIDKVVDLSMKEKVEYYRNRT
jgi:predicted aldo/keto reductase-like oxidoreductase